MPVFEILAAKDFFELFNPDDDTKAKLELNYKIKLKSVKYIFVDFFADWCKPCQKISPFIEKLSEKYKNILFLKVNVEGKTAELAEKYNINSMPTFLIFCPDNPNLSFQPIIGADPVKIENRIKSLDNSSPHIASDF